jgi:hypothetical protein
MNFGTPGVLAGFVVLGFILMRLDQKTMRGLAMGNIDGVVRAVLPGLALIQPLGNLLEVVVAVASAIIASEFLVRSKLLRLSPRSHAKMRTMRVTERR